MAEAWSRGGRCSAISALPTGCCGDPAIRATIVAAENQAHDVARPVSYIAAPNRRPPVPSNERRLTTRCSGA